MFVQNIVIIDAVQSFLDLKQIESPSKEQVTLTDWLRVEVYVFISLISSAIVFLFVRSICRNKIHINIPAVIEHHQRDFLSQNLALIAVL